MSCPRFAILALSLPIALGACGPDAPSSRRECFSGMVPIAEGFGARGPYAVRRQTLPHPKWPGLWIAIEEDAPAFLSWVPSSAPVFSWAAGDRGGPHRGTVSDGHRLPV